jgi:predicted metal-binding protein
MFYVVSGGSVNAKNVDRSFQYINIYAPDQQKLADICRYTYKSEALQVPESFSIPPQETATKTSARLLEILQDVDFEIYREYDENIKEADTISKYFDLDKIIDYLSTVFTCFDSLINELKRNNNVYLILLVLHYRINFLNEKNERINKVTDAKVLLKTKIKNAVLDDDFLNAAIKLLESKNDTDFIDNYKSMEDRFKKHDRYLSYIVITMFFTDLYLILSNYGEVYYRNEKLMHNVNIKLDNDTFHINVPKEFISLTSDIDRRLVIISFKCKNPTVHKIAVLIVKNFERKMNYIEDAFKRLGLKLYYLNPKVEKSSYDLENQNFEAYIPTLIPLLTGKQIYTKDEVFIRELIQNSLDAILLREKILQEENHELPEEERAIKIVFNKEPNEKDGGERGYIQIIDHGIGMDEFKIERYFTSIGRSFYKSDEFAKLKNDKNIKYNPISNFGIGFLSAFMVCKEITVRTKSYEYPDSNGIEIHIPNYDGCFFVKQIDDQRQHIGTIITLYEDSDNKFDIKKYIQYIKQTFLDFQLPIIIDDKFNNDITTIEPYKIRENMDNVLFCPIDDNGNLERISLEEIKNSVFQNYKHGVLLKFDTDTKKQDHIYLNSGIFLSSTFIESMEFNKRYYHPTCYYNFPSKLIELDVSREIIKNFPAPKNDLSNSNIKNFNNKLLIMLSEQATEMLESLTNNPNTKLHDLFHFTTFFEKNLQHSIINFCDYNYKFCLTGNHPGLKLTLVKKNKGDNISNDSVYILFDFYYFSLIDFIRKNASSSNDLINEIAKKAYDPFVSLYKKVVFNVFSILSEDVYRFTDELFDNRRELFDIAQDEFRLFDRGDIRFLLDRFDVPDRIEKLFNRPMHFSIDNQMVKNMNERINKLGKMLRNVEFITDIHSYRGKYKGTKTKDRIAFYAYSVFQSLLHHTNKSSAAILHPLLFFIYIYLDIIKSMDINDANKFTFEIPCL